VNAAVRIGPCIGGGGGGACFRKFVLVVCPLLSSFEARVFSVIYFISSFVSFVLLMSSYNENASSKGLTCILYLFFSSIVSDGMRKANKQTKKTKKVRKELS